MRLVTPSPPGDAERPRRALGRGVPIGYLAWLEPWALFVCMLGVGRVLAGDSVLRIDELVFGMPLAWLVGFAAARADRVISRARGAVAAASFAALALAGLLIGLLGPLG